MGGGCRVETCCSDVTSAAGRQDGRGKLACATAEGRGTRGRICGKEKNTFSIKAHLYSREMCKTQESLKHESRLGTD